MKQINTNKAWQHEPTHSRVNSAVKTTSNLHQYGPADGTEEMAKEYSSLCKT